MEAGDSGGSRVHCYKCAGEHDCLYKSVGQQLEQPHKMTHVIKVLFAFLSSTLAVAGEK